MEPTKQTRGGNIELGTTVWDQVTGFKGIAVAVQHDITGHTYYLVEPTWTPELRNTRPAMFAQERLLSEANAAPLALQRTGT